MRMFTINGANGPVTSEELLDIITQKAEEAQAAVQAGTIQVRDGEHYLELVAGSYNDLFQTIGGELAGFHAFVVANDYTRKRPAKYPFGGKIIAQDEDGTTSVSMAYVGIPAGDDYLSPYLFPQYAVRDIGALLRVPLLQFTPPAEDEGTEQAWADDEEAAA